MALGNSYSENEHVLTEGGMIQHRRTLHLVQLSCIMHHLPNSVKFSRLTGLSRGTSDTDLYPLPPYRY